MEGPTEIHAALRQKEKDNTKMIPHMGDKNK